MNFNQAINNAISLNQSNVHLVGQLCQLEDRVDNGLNFDENLRYLERCLRVPGVLFLINNFFY